MNFKKVVVGLSMLFSLGTAFSQETLLRVRCEADSEGANIFINGQLKGQCPTDLALPQGQVNLKVIKNLERGRYRAFERDFLLSAGAIKRFDVTLGDILFTPEGRKLEDARLATERAAAEKRAAEEAAAREAARLQAERDAPRLAAEKKAAEERAAIELKAQQEAARRAEPGAVKNYMNSSNNDKINPSTATTFATYAPLFLPVSTTTDLVSGKSIAMADPAVFGNPRSMMAQAAQQQQQREARSVAVALR